MKMNKHQLEFLKLALSGNKSLSLKQLNTQIKVLNALIDENITALEKLSNIEDSRKQFVVEILEVAGYTQSTNQEDQEHAKLTI